MINIDYKYCLKKYIKDGITPDDLNSFKPKIKKITENIINNWEKNSDGYGFLNLPDDTKLTKEITTYAKRLKNKIDDFVVIGIGGSALGNIVLQNTLNPLYWNLMDKKQRKNYPRIFILDNVDPDWIKNFLQIVNLRKIMINVISKAGTTAECLANYFIIKKELEKLKLNLKDHIIITTNPKTGFLKEEVERLNLKTFIIPENVIGRDSVLSAVGLVSAAFGNIDIFNLLKGAKINRKKSLNPDLFKNPAALYAVLNYIFYKKGRNIVVMMPYAQSLYYIADWFRQLWAESLGKKYDNKKNEVFVGITPVKALGVTDQHSQLQLYMEGPQDKFITFLSVKNFKTKLLIPNYNHYLGNKYLFELLKAEELATKAALKENSRPSCSITIDKITPCTIGEVIMMFEISCCYLAELLNINAFDQPGVELGKNITYALMGRKGYENFRKLVK